MKEIFELFIHDIITLLRLMKPVDVKPVVADALTMKQQLIVLKCNKKKSLNLWSLNRFIFGFLAIFLGKNRLHISDN